MYSQDCVPYVLLESGETFTDTDSALRAYMSIKSKRDSLYSDFERVKSAADVNDFVILQYLYNLDLLDFNLDFLFNYINSKEGVYNAL